MLLWGGSLLLLDAILLPWVRVVLATSMLDIVLVVRIFCIWIFAVFVRLGS